MLETEISRVIFLENFQRKHSLAVTIWIFFFQRLLECQRAKTIKSQTYISFRFTQKITTEIACSKSMSLDVPWVTFFEFIFFFQKHVIRESTKLQAEFFPKIRKTYQKFHNLLEKRNSCIPFYPPPHFHLRFSMCVHELLSNVHFCNQKVFEKSFQWLLRTSEDGICSSVEFLPKDEPQQLGKILDIMGRWVWSPPPLPLWLLPPFKYFLIPRLNTSFIATFKLTKKVPHYQHVIKPHYWKGIVIRDRKRHN